MGLADKVVDIFKNDGWANILTGLGTKAKDKRLSAAITFNLISEADVEHLYGADDMAAKTVNKLPLDMVREGFRLVSPDLEDDVLDAAIDYFENLVLTEQGNKLGKAMIWGRLYGGAGFVIGTDTDDDPEEPLDLERLGSIAHLTLLTRYELVPHDINGDPTSSNYSMPENYTFNPRVTGTAVKGEIAQFVDQSVKIHHTRVIRFDGNDLPRQLFIQNQFWNDSILNKLQGPIRDFQASFDSTVALIMDFAQAVYKVKNLASIIASPDGMKTMQDRIAIIDTSRSVLRAAIIDADGEDFERKTTSLAGLDKVLDKIMDKFASTTEYPHTVLFGASPKGALGGKGNSEKEDYFETVRSKQTHDLKPRLIRMFKLIFAAGDGPTRGKVPDKLDIEFEPLKHLNQAEMITARKEQAEADKIYMETGAVDPTEIATSRFGSGEYSFETEIDTDLRESMETTIDKDETEEQRAVRIDAAHRKRRPKGNRSRKFGGKRYRK